MTQKNKKILAKFKPFLWSYDIEKIDLEKDKKRIITNILNLGTKEATDLLFTVYSREEIEEPIKNPLSGEWNNKSFNYWTIIFGINHQKKPNALRNIR